MPVNVSQFVSDDKLTVTVWMTQAHARLHNLALLSVSLCLLSPISMHTMAASFGVLSGRNWSRVAHSKSQQRCPLPRMLKKCVCVSGKLGPRSFGKCVCVFTSGSVSRQMPSRALLCLLTISELI